jgi:carboxyl-terminal processing protease
MTHKLRSIAFFCLLAQAGLYAQTEGKYFEIAKNMEIFANAYREVNQSYVDELDPGKLMAQGLDAMLEGLDPFTNYISETDIEGFRLQTDGRYSGLGASGKLSGDYVVVTDILEGSPAQKAGLKVGDAFLSIDGQNAKGRTQEQVMEFLRGFPGTKVNLVLRRPGDAKDLKIALERGEVEVPNVPHSGLVADGIGYVNLTTFSQDAGPNVGAALERLKQKNPSLRGVILDLRGNGGGLLAEAVNLVNVFTPKGEFVASTKGKVPEWDISLRTMHAPIDKDIPVVVLMDSHSASASEVTSGALQDMDRAVIMGQRSYGKGLVQNTKDLGYNAKIKLTTAKYYVPSGRCIQSVQYKNGEPVDIPESQRAQFKTRNGRLVYDGGGIKPDVVLPRDTASVLVKELLNQNVLFDFVTEYSLKQGKPDSIETFSYTDFDAFSRFLSTRNFKYETTTEKKITELREIAAKEGLSLQADFDALQRRIEAEKKNDLAEARERILYEIEQDIIGRYFYERGKVRKRLVNDSEVKEAVKLLNDQARYKAILAGK